MGTGSELKRGEADKSLGERESRKEREGGKRLKTDRVNTVYVNGKGRRRFMEKEEEALSVSGVLLFRFCFFFFL